MYFRADLFATQTETSRTIEVAMLLVVAHTVAADLGSVADEVILKLFDGLIQ